MNIFEWIIIITFIAGVGGTGLGGFIGAIIKQDSNKIVSLFLSFAGGIMLSVVCFDLIESALHTGGLEKTNNLFIVIGGILLGYLLIYLLNNAIDKATNHEVKHIDDNHPKTADDLNELIHEDHYEEHKKMNSKYQLFIGGGCNGLSNCFAQFARGYGYRSFLC